LLGEENTVPLLNRNPVTRKLVIRRESGCGFGTRIDVLALSLDNVKKGLDGTDPDVQTL